MSHTAAGAQQHRSARNPEVWVEAGFVVMAAHGLARLADGLRLPLEFEPSNRKPLVAVPEAAAATREVLDEAAAFFSMKTAPAVLRALARRPAYLKTSWDFIRRALEAGLLESDRKALLALAVSAAAGSDYGTDLFGHHARRLGVDEDAVWETLAVVQRFAGLTKFASALDLEPDIFPKWAAD